MSALEGMSNVLCCSTSGARIPSNFSIPASAEEILCCGSVSGCRPCRKVSIRCIRFRKESCEAASLKLGEFTGRKPRLCLRSISLRRYAIVRPSLAIATWPSVVALQSERNSVVLLGSSSFDSDCMQEWFGSSCRDPFSSVFDLVYRQEIRHDRKTGERNRCLLGATCL